VLAAVMVASACSSGKSSGTTTGSSASSSTTSASGPSGVTDLLGPPKQATGVPVNVGVISDGRNPAADNSVEEDVAKDTFAYLDGYGGIGGRPVKVYTCETHGDPGGATDCANQMIQNGVVAVVIGQSAVVTNVYTPLHAAHVPTFLYGVFDKTVLSDTGSTFALGNPYAALADLPIAVAQANNIKKVTAAVIDVPAATGFWEQEGPAEFSKAGLGLDVVRIPISAADVTPQMQRIVSSGQKTLVHAIGASSTCIAVLNGLHAVGFTGPVTLVQQCVDNSTRKAVPASVLKGIYMSATAPVGDPNDPGLKIYTQEIAPKVSGKVDPGSAAELMFISVMGFHVAVEGISGDITPQTVAATIKQMPSKLLPGGGGVHFRCNGQAVAASPALCVRGGLVTQLDDTGQPTTYKPVGDSPY
jgi:branched-chain amino acid transport system substrate-binding protein